MQMPIVDVPRGTTTAKQFIGRVVEVSEVADIHKSSVLPLGGHWRFRRRRHSLARTGSWHQQQQHQRQGLDQMQPRPPAFLVERARAVEERLGRIEKRAPIRLKEQHERIKRTVGELIGAAGADPQRIAQEVAILADKLDVAEELDRFRSHLNAFRDTARSDTAEPVGKRLGFILQEMVREANTIGSKANDAPILEDVIATKEELERIREQVENLE